MAGRHAKARTRSRNPRLRRRAAIGLSTTAGAFLAAAIGPICTAPQAKADFGIDDLIMNLLDPGALAAAVEPAATIDLSSLLADLFSGTGATDTAALAVPDLPDPTAVVAAGSQSEGDPGADSPDDRGAAQGYGQAPLDGARRTPDVDSEHSPRWE